MLAYGRRSACVSATLVWQERRAIKGFWCANQPRGVTFTAWTLVLRVSAESWYAVRRMRVRLMLGVGVGNEGSFTT